ARNCTYYDFVLNLGDIYDKNIDTMTLDELRFLYAGYLHTYGSTYDVGGVTLEIKGGDTYNAIGLDCGRVVQDYYGKKVYYTELFKAVSYVPFAMNNVNYYFQNGPSYWDNTDGKIVGVYVNKRVVDEDGYLSYYNSDTFIFNDILYSRAESIEPTVYSFFIAPMPKDRAQIEKLVNIHYDLSGERVFNMENGATYMLGMVNDILEVLGQVFLYVGIGLAVFSMLLLSNYIAVSISYKKREIGILRAVGAKSSDVFSIFFSESLVIALINFVLSMVVCGVGCIVINSMLRSEYGLQITLLNFGFRQIALMLVISVAVAIISSFLPVYRLSKKKPIDTIRTA
ncbi:MAG: ABC transporter permease, partial [Clostridia bacterium]|nr:ABC transporter permease [Clostridia bacterium]